GDSEAEDSTDTLASGVYRTQMRGIVQAGENGGFNLNPIPIDAEDVDPESESLYRLKGGILHGGGLGGGHYTAFVGTGSGDRRQYHNCNDSYTRPISRETALRENHGSVVLFYERE
ncbi:hypothetical protein KIPB_013762, partial [Kipferlia bialata]